MKRNLLILLAIVALCATTLALLERSRGLDVATESPEAHSYEDIKEPSLESATQEPESSKELSYIVKVGDNQAEFQLINGGKSTHHFYSDSLEIRGLGVPGHADVQVLKEDGTLFDTWDSQIQADSWSPLLVSSYAKTNLPAEPRAINPGETLSLVVPLENFFSKSKMAWDTEDYRVRVVSRVYLDPYLTKYIKSRSDWVPLKLPKNQGAVL